MHTFVHGAHFDLHLISSSWFCPIPLHAGLCCRRHDLAAQTLGFVGRPGFSGNIFGVCLGPASDPPTESRCVGSGLSSGLSWFG